MIRVLKRRRPNAELFLLSGVPGTEDILPRSVRFAGQWRIPIREFQTGGITGPTFVRLLGILIKLRRMRFDITITTVPSNSILWNLVAFCIGAPVRIIHQYPNKRGKTLFFLQNKRVLISQGIHDIQQNLNLLKPLGITVTQKENMRLALKPEEIERARFKLVDHSSKVIAFHVGCDPNAPRRWPLERYVGLMEKIAEHYVDVRFLLNAGPAEIEDSRAVAQMAAHLPHPPRVIIPESIYEAAAVLTFCSLLISNDSGVMHIGVGVGIPVVSLFGPSDNIRMAPYQDQNNVVCADEPCRPCTTTLGNIGERFSCRRKRHYCWENLTVNMVYDRVADHL